MGHQGAHEAGARPPPSWTGCGPPRDGSFAGIFYIFQKYSPWSFRSFRELLFLHKNNTMVILLKIASVRVSSIQIMQVRVQNKGKSVWKSRYDRDVPVIQDHIESLGKPILLKGDEVLLNGLLAQSA